MPVPLARPVPEVFDRLKRGRGVQSPEPVVPPDDADHFDVDNRRCGVVGIGGEARPDIVGPCGVGDDFVETASVNDQHLAIHHVARRAPRPHRPDRCATVYGSCGPATPPRSDAPQAGWPPCAATPGQRGPLRTPAAEVPRRRRHQDRATGWSWAPPEHIMRERMTARDTACRGTTVSSSAQPLSISLRFTPDHVKRSSDVSGKRSDRVSGCATTVSVDVTLTPPTGHGYCLVDEHGHC